MSDSATAVMNQLHSFIVREMLDGDDSDLDENTHLLQSGVMNSRAVVKLIAFVEETYGTTLSFKELTAENLKSIKSMAQMIVGATTKDG